jgi:hypothetical protein
MSTLFAQRRTPMTSDGLVGGRFLIAGVCALLLFLPIDRAAAAFVSFNDAVAGQPYVLGNMFTSEGVKFTVVLFNSLGTTPVDVQVGPTPFGDPPGTDPSAYPNNINLEMDLAGSIGQQSFVRIQFTDSGGSVNLGVNGPPMEAADFFSFPPLINGVSVNVTPLLPSGRGMIELSGAVDRVVFGGQESVFDDIFTIPEPASIFLAAMAAMLVWTVRSRRET